MKIVKFTLLDDYYVIESGTENPLTVLPHPSYRYVICGERIYPGYESNLPSSAYYEGAEVFRRPEKSGWIIIIPLRKPTAKIPQAVLDLAGVTQDDRYSRNADYISAEKTNPHNSYTFGLGVE